VKGGGRHDYVILGPAQFDYNFTMNTNMKDYDGSFFDKYNSHAGVIGNPSRGVTTCDAIQPGDDWATDHKRGGEREQKALKQRRASAATTKNHVTGTFCR